jgi:pimeloyl-ACP methyl ester carboxylesterase
MLELEQIASADIRWSLLLHQFRSQKSWRGLYSAELTLPDMLTSLSTPPAAEITCNSRVAGDRPRTSNKGTQMEIQTGYARVHGLQLYYEIHGTANRTHPPLALLHGGGDTIQTSFGQVLPALARDRQVIEFEQQGFGHTADIAGRPFSFAQSSDDSAALLEYLHIGQADLFGFSNGGTIALQVAIRHPQIVRNLVTGSGFYQREGSSYPWFWDGFAHATPEKHAERVAGGIPRSCAAPGKPPELFRQVRRTHAQLPGHPG